MYTPGITLFRISLVRIAVVAEWSKDSNALIAHAMGKDVIQVVHRIRRVKRMRPLGMVLPNFF